jgi:hypothetical protein
MNSDALEREKRLFLRVHALMKYLEYQSLRVQDIESS